MIFDPGIALRGLDLRGSKERRRVRYVEVRDLCGQLDLGTRFRNALTHLLRQYPRKLFGATVEEVREAYLEPRLYRTVGPVGFVKGIRHAQSRLEFGIRVVGECCDDFTRCWVNASVRQGLSPYKKEAARGWSILSTYCVLRSEPS